MPKSINGAPAPACNTPPLLSVNESRTVYRALHLLRRKLSDHPVALSSPQAVRDYLALELAAEEREVFMCLWLDNQHRLIEAERLSMGTLSQAAVYPRECVKSAMRHNAAAVIVAHNHPGGNPNPSAADLSLTRQLAETLNLVDVRLLDHFIVAGAGSVVSLAERGLIDTAPPFVSLPVCPPPVRATRARSAKASKPGRAAK